MKKVPLYRRRWWGGAFEEELDAVGADAVAVLVAMRAQSLRGVGRRGSRSLSRKRRVGVAGVLFEDEEVVADEAWALTKGRVRLSGCRG